MRQCNVNLPKWCYASILKHFNTGLTSVYPDLPVVIPTMEHKNVNDQNRFEILIQGPRIVVLTSNRLYYTVKVLNYWNFLDENLYEQQEIVGNVVALFTDIPLLKLGGDTGDDGSSVGCIRLAAEEANISVSDWGNIGPEQQMNRATVTAVYLYDDEQ